MAITFTVLDVTFVALRFLSKYLGSNPFGMDDCLVVLAFAFCLGGNIAALRQFTPEQLCLQVDLRI